MTRATLVLLLAALAITATVRPSPSQSLTDGRTPPNASTRPLDAFLAYSGAVGGGGSPSTGTGGPSPVGPGLTSVVVGGSGNQSGGAEEVIPVAPSVPSATHLDLADFALATPRVSFVVRSGIASTYGPAFSEWWVALPEGPGWRFRVCGAGGCRTLVSTDSGPDRAMQRAGRIVDLPVGAFEAVCGVPWTFGLCQVSLTMLGRVW